MQQAHCEALLAGRFPPLRRACGAGQESDALCAVCRAFPTTQEGMRYCEDQFLEVAQQHGLCRPSQSVLSLRDILELHASVVRPMQLSQCLSSAALSPCPVGCPLRVCPSKSVTISQMDEHCASLAHCSPNVQICRIS